MRHYLILFLLICGTCWATDPTRNKQIDQNFPDSLFLAQADISPVVGLTAAFVTDTTYSPYHETWYVTQNGTGNGTSIDSPMSLATLNAKTDFDTANGDVGIFLIGTINDTVKLSVGGSSTGQLILRGDYPGQPATIQVSGNNGEEAFDLSGLSRIVLYNEATRATIDGQVASGGPDDVDHANDQLINLTNSSFITIDNWEIKRGWNGIKSDSVSDFNMYRCKVTLNRIYGAYFGADSEEIRIGGSFANANDFYQNTYKTTLGDNHIGADIFFNINNSAGIKANIEVTHNEIHSIDNDEGSGWGMLGVGLSGVQQGLVQYNTIHDMGAFNFRAGIFADGVSLNQDLIIRYNNIYDLTTAQEFEDGGGILITGDSKNVLIDGNRIHNAQSGIGLDVNRDSERNSGKNGIHTEDVFIWANSISNVNAYGIALLDTLSANIDDYDDIYVVNNSVHMTTAGSSEHMTAFYSQFNYGSGDDGTDDTGANPHITVKNNIFSEGRYGQTRKFNVAVSENSDGNWMALDYNLGYDSTDDDNYTVRFGPAADGSDDVDYDSGSLPTSWCANDPTPADPMFVNTPIGTLELNQNSPAISKATDMSGVLVPSITVDGSAYTFSLDSILTPATNWSTIPPTIRIKDQDDEGKTIGAYSVEKISVYFVSPTGGSGTRDGKSIETAWSAADLQSKTTWWSSSEHPDKLDPGDILYPKGSGWNSAHNLTIYQGITLDLYESGNYDPETMSHSLDPVFGASIFVTADNVTIQDGRFTAWSYPISIAVTNGAKISGVKVLRNYIRTHTGSGGGTGIRIGFMTDSEIAYNYIGDPDASSSDCCYTTSCPSDSWIMQGITFCAGSRNKIHHNHIKGAKVALFMPGTMTWDHDKYTIDYPSSGSYAIDPDVNYLQNEIAYNYIELKCQEGISLDIAGSSGETWGFSIVERDTVASINGSVVTLNNSGGEWTGVGNRWSGFYMLAIANRDDTFGNHALIEAQSANTFTLSSAITNLQVGDEVIISSVAKNNWVHHNTWEAKGFPGSSMLLEGSAIENIVEKNTFPTANQPEGYGASVKMLYGWVTSSYSATEEPSSGVTAYNIVRDNTMGRILNMAHDKGLYDSTDFTIRNNAFYDNTFHVNANYPRKIILRRAYPYLNNNKYANGESVIVDTADGLSGKRATDPTGFVVTKFDSIFSEFTP